MAVGDGYLSEGWPLPSTELVMWLFELLVFVELVAIVLLEALVLLAVVVIE